MRPLPKLCIILALSFVVSGCSFLHRSQMSDFNSAYAQGNYERALKSMDFEQAEDGDVDTEGQLLEILHQAELHRLQGNFQRAADYYDLAEQGMKHLDTESTLEEGGEAFASVMVNDSVSDYEAMMSEAVLVNTYKGLAFLAAGNSEFARVEFNRADERTRRAINYFEGKIKKQKNKLEAEAAKANDDESTEEGNKALFAKRSLESTELQSTVAENYGQPSQWSVYPEFMVPTSTYLHGLYFLANAETSSDYSKAKTSLKRVAEMIPESEQLASDAELATKLASGEKSSENLASQVWIVYENGLGPVLKEKRFDVPLLLFHGNQQAPAYTGIALPQYEDRSAINGSLLAMAGTENKSVETENIGEMGRVFQTEMEARFPGILTRAVTSAVIKAVIQNEAAEQFGFWGQLGSAAFTAATTQADLRGWQALPDHWQSARMMRPEGGQIELAHTDGTRLGTVSIPEQSFTLVYVKRPTKGAPASVVTLDLQGNNEATVAQMPVEAKAVNTADNQ